MDLSDAYENAAHIPGGDGYLALWADAAARFRAACGDRFVAGFDPETRRGSDLVLPEAAPRGLMVFVHGGYWMRFSPRDWTHLAAGALAHGWAVALPGYGLAPALRIAEITRAVAGEIADVAARVDGPIVLAGHSAGGHLAARMLAPGVLPDAVLARIDRAAPISPLSNLSPLLRTGLNETLRLTPEEAMAESPVTQPRPEVPVKAWVGAAERPAFLDQARWLGEAWNVPRWELPGRHHFDVVEDLEAPDSALVTWLLVRD
jgi:acetyl esterase/lipase